MCEKGTSWFPELGPCSGVMVCWCGLSRLRFVWNTCDIRTHTEMDDQNLDFKDDIISHPSKVALLLTVVLHVGAHYLLENPLQSLAQALAF